MKRPNGRQVRFANSVLSGKSAAESARLAGYSDEYAKKAAAALLNQPAVAALIKEGQAELRGKTMFDLQQAIIESDSLIAFALSKSNAMAAAKLLELKCKLHGLLIERVQAVDMVDIAGALSEARQRANGTIQISSTAISIEASRSHIAHDKNPHDIFS